MGIVSKTAPNFVEKEEAANELISGPNKKPIIVPSSDQEQQNAAVPLSNFAYAATQQSQVNNEEPNMQTNIDDNTQSNADDLFGGMVQQTNEQKDDNLDDTIPSKSDEMKQNVELEAEEEEKQTFLSVWQEEHRDELMKKGKEERKEQEKLNEAGKAALDAFNQKRQDRIEQQRKDQSARESDVRKDYDAVFATGSIWQQVAKLVDLKSKQANEKRERMRDLLIILKNADENKK